MTAKLSTLLVGFGRIAQGYAADPQMSRSFRYSTHAQVLRDHPGFSFDAVVDPVVEKLHAAEKDWSVPHVAESLEALSNRETIEVAVLATSPGHRLEALNALPSLKAVLVEKPLGRDLDDAAHFCRVCDERNILVQVNLLRRADERTRELASGRLKDELGAIQAISGVYGNGLKNNGTHMIDLIRMLVGEVRAVTAIGSESFEEGPDGDINFPFALTLENICVTMQPLKFSHYRENGLDIWGTNGRLQYMHGGLTIVKHGLSPNRMLSDEMEVASDCTESMATTLGEAMYEMYSNLAECLHARSQEQKRAGGQQCPYLFSPADSALQTTRVVDALLQSFREGGTTIAVKGKTILDFRPVVECGSTGLSEISAKPCEMTGLNRKADVLIFAEDPGAANFVAGLPEALSKKGISSLLLADGLAVRYFSDRAIDARKVDGDTGSGALLDALQPKLVLTGTSENRKSMGLSLIDESRKRGVVSAAVIDMQVNAALRFKGEGDSSLTHMPDWLLVPDVGTVEAFQQLGYPASNIIECGHPHFDRVLEIRDKLKGEDLSSIRKRVLDSPLHGKSLVVFVAEPTSILNPGLLEYSEQYTFMGRGKSRHRTHIVLDEFLDALEAARKAVFLVVRLHPKNSLDEFAQYKTDVDSFSSGGNPLELIWAADLVVGMSSMLLQEATIMGKRCLSILPRMVEKDWMPCTASGAIPCALTTDQVHYWTSRLLNDFEEADPNDDVNERQLFRRGALDRVVSFVEERMRSPTSRLS